MTIYRHDALIRAWLDGETIQYRSGLLWVDMPKPGEADKFPHFYVCDEYRVKPRVFRVRVGILADGTVLAADSLESERIIERMTTFGKWISDWTEYSA